MTTVVGLFRQYENAERAMDELVADRFEMNEISAIVPEGAAPKSGRTTIPNAGGATSTLASDSGTVAGNAGILGLGGTISGLKGTAMPGLGTVRTSGPLLSGEGSQTINAAEMKKGGNLAEALVARGIPAADAEIYGEGVRRGHILLAVDTDRVSDVKAIFNRNNVADTTALAKGWALEGRQDR